MGGGYGSGEPKKPLDDLAFYLLVEEYEHRRALAKRLGKTIESFDPVFTAYVQRRTRAFSLDIGATKCDGAGWPQL